MGHLSAPTSGQVKSFSTRPRDCSRLMFPIRIPPMTVSRDTEGLPLLADPPFLPTHSGDHALRLPTRRPVAGARQPRAGGEVNRPEPGNTENSTTLASSASHRECRP